VILLFLFVSRPRYIKIRNKNIFCRVIQYTKTSYQLNSVYGLVSGRFQHQELNTIDKMAGQGVIPNLTWFIPKKKKEKDLSF
jgi:hypothetical protein